jgi:RNA-directed DNA polymerase
LIHQNKEILELCIGETKIWLTKIGLSISEEKSSIKDSREGFLFLGFQIIMVRKKSKNKYKVKITPSKPNRLNFTSKIQTLIQHNKAASSFQLIAELRSRILGWANYFKYCECKKAFTKMDFLIFQKLRAWIFRRDSKNSKTEIKQRYFPENRTYTFQDRAYQDNWILVGHGKGKKGEKKTNFLPRMAWVASEKFVKVQGAQSPYDGDPIYWAQRTARLSNYSTRLTKLLKNQKGACSWCKQMFTPFDAEFWEIDHIKPRCLGGKDTYSNLQLLHKHCHMVKTRTDGSRGLSTDT